MIGMDRREEAQYKKKALATSRRVSKVPVVLIVVGVVAAPSPIGFVIGMVAFGPTPDRIAAAASLIDGDSRAISGAAGTATLSTPPPPAAAAATVPVSFDARQSRVGGGSPFALRTAAERGEMEGLDVSDLGES